jgi:vacuolar-type H+-ATPase catalytic subunit A/Vma1
LAGILTTIFDGIQRPLKTIAQVSKSVFVPRGVDVPSLDQDKLWDYTPLKNLKVGQLLVGGDMLGSTFENDLFSEHRIMVSPKITGRIVEVMPAG